MADVTVAQFAEVLKVPVERLLAQLDEAGIKVGGADDDHQRRSQDGAADAPASQPWRGEESAALRRARSR